MQNLQKLFWEPVNGLTHLAGAVLATIGMIWLMGLTWETADRVIVVLIYGVGMVLMFSSSAVLHLTHCSGRVRRWLVRADHAAIYIMIAGTYTPFCYIVLTSDGWRWGMLAVIWALAAAGAFYKLFLRKRESHWSTVGYVAMGWLAVVLAPQVLNVVSSAVLWLVVGGGVTYSVGAVVFALRKPNLHKYFGFHELWHLFVLAGSALHFVAVLLLLLER